MNEQDNHWDSVVVSSCCEKLVTEVRDSSGTQRKGGVCCWKSLPETGEDTAG
jgi:hypothetical protein